jgi:hypothetical protein
MGRPHRTAHVTGARPAEPSSYACCRTQMAPSRKRRVGDRRGAPCRHCANRVGRCRTFGPTQRSGVGEQSGDVHDAGGGGIQTWLVGAQHGDCDSGGDDGPGARSRAPTASGAGVAVSGQFGHSVTTANRRDKWVNARTRDSCSGVRCGPPPRPSFAPPSSSSPSEYVRLSL